jgi:catechol 2,3-dioxygenase-like lactoylglutathione lyase family enzyme
VLGSGCTGCDAARLSRDGRTLFVVTHGFGPSPGPGTIYEIDVGSTASMRNPLGLKAHHITARVRDIARATAWYHDVLGLELAEHGERMEGVMKYATLRLPGFAVSLVQFAQPATEVAAAQPLVPDWVHIVFSVPDPDALYRALQARGEHLAMHGPPPSGPVESFLVYDSEGNEIEIVGEDGP